MSLHVIAFVTICDEVIAPPPVIRPSLNVLVQVQLVPSPRIWYLTHISSYPLYIWFTTLQNQQFKKLLESFSSLWAIVHPIKLSLISPLNVRGWWNMAWSPDGNPTSSIPKFWPTSSFLNVPAIVIFVYPSDRRMVAWTGSSKSDPPSGLSICALSISWVVSGTSLHFRYS